jgi:DNA-binding Lrp family transcriptional regulator
MPPGPMVGAMGHDPRLPGTTDPSHLDERVLTTLQGLSGRLAFSGLRRYLGTHPESLSRSLRRLEREGLVERVDGGYRALAPAPRVDARSDRDLRSIAAIDLPPGTSPEDLLGRLVGRWFGALRWVGLLERPDGELLAWARRDGAGLVLLGLERGVLSVYVPALRGDDDPAEAEDAAYELLFHAVEALRPGTAAAPPTLAPVRAFALGPPASVGPN